MQATQVEKTTKAFAPDPSVDELCRSIVDDATLAVAKCDDVDALWLAGSLAAGRACGTMIKGKPYLLSDVDFVVVPRSSAPVTALRSRLAAIADHVTTHARDRGFVSHAEFGVVTQRTIHRPRDRLLLHDIARTGRTLAGDESLLERLRANLRGRRVDAEEGRILVLNRIAGQLFMLDKFASDDPLERLLARFHFAKVYADNEVAIRVVKGGYQRRSFRHTVIERHAERAERWRVFRRTPLANPGNGAKLLTEWKTCARDQLEMAAACGALKAKRSPIRLTNAVKWSRLTHHRPAFRERLGLGGSPLQVAHERSAELMRELVEGRHANIDDWAIRTAETVGLWRAAVTGMNDTRPDFASIVAGYLRESA